MVQRGQRDQEVLQVMTGLTAERVTKAIRVMAGPAVHTMELLVLLHLPQMMALDLIQLTYGVRRANRVFQVITQQFRGQQGQRVREVQKGPTEPMV